MLDNAAMLRYQALSDTSYSRSAQLVSLSDVRDAQENGILRFCLPDAPTDTLVAEAALIKDHPLTGFSWSGNLISGGNGYAIFRINDDQRSAFISVDGRQYEIVALSDEIQALIRRKQDFSLVNNCAVELPGDITFGLECKYDYNTCHALIDILIVVDPDAADEIEQTHGTLGAWLGWADLLVNLAFWNSDIPNKEVTVKWIEMGGFTYTSNTGNGAIAIDVENFSIFSEDNLLRSIHNVDFVFLLTQERYPPYGGVVNEIGPSTGAAYAIVETSSFYKIQAFAHELGHLFGCRHEWGADPTTVCEHGHTQLNLVPPLLNESNGSGTLWYTLMTTPLNVNTPVLEIEDVNYYVQNQGAILHYSNPHVNYGGQPTGNTGVETENNAQQIRNAGCIASNYTATSNLDVEITKNITCTSISFTAEAIAPAPGSLGQAPYYYTWHWSPDGVFDINVLTNNQISTTATAILTEPPACPVFWIRCTVSSGDGIFITRIFKVNMMHYSCDCNTEVPPDEHSSDVQSPENTIILRPNPAGDFIQLLADDFLAPGEIVIFSADGKMMFSDLLSGDKNRYTISLSSFSSGTYFIRLISGEKVSLFSFIKR